MPIVPPESGPNWVGIIDAPIPTDRAMQWATIPSSGAVVVFSGVVRDHAEGRDGVFAMTYEAYVEPAEQRLAEVAAAARDKWPATERLVLLHRIGELSLGEASVLVVASSAHRDIAFDVARFCIDTLKATVPVWKKEHFGEASEWAHGAQSVGPVSRAGA